ncbi:MAG: MoxR family ATPase [Sporolactobacillus sp.]
MITACQRLIDNVRSVLVGKDTLTENLLIALICGGHVLMEDVPGTGKTMLAKTVAKSIQGDFKRIQFTPDILPSDITGINYFNAKTQVFETRLGPVMTTVLLADEINRATPRAQSSLLEVMEEHQVTIDGVTYPIAEPFLVIATQNPIESQGTFPLPEAQMDRFFMQLASGYPSLDEEKQMMKMYRQRQPLEAVQPILTLEELRDLHTQVAGVTISDPIFDYMLQIVHATRNQPSVAAGVSPRGTLAFMRAVQGHAFIAGRPFATPDDVKQMAVPVLAHRLVLSLDGELRATKQQVIAHILEDCEVPVESGSRSRK